MTTTARVHHACVALQLSPSQLIEILKDIRAEKAEMSQHLTSNELSKYDELIEIYENALNIRILPINKRKSSTTFH